VYLCLFVSVYISSDVAAEEDELLNEYAWDWVPAEEEEEREEEEEEEESLLRG